MSHSNVGTLLCRFALPLAILVVTGSVARAQSSVFNAPSTDTQPRGSLYTEAGLTAHVAPYESGGFTSLGLRGIYGLTDRLEVGSNLYHTRAGGDVALSEVQVNAKWKARSEGDGGVAVALGGSVSIPVTRGDIADPYGVVYAVASKRLSNEHGPRITGGAYVRIGSGPGTRAGAIVGIEQSLTSRLYVVSDWQSGTSSLGAVSSGVGYYLTSRTVVGAGYTVGNQGRGNNRVAFFVGHTF